MAKKKKWWFGDSDEDNSVMFPNTVKQHNEKIYSAPVYSQGQLISGEEYDEDEYAEVYGWGKKPQELLPSKGTSKTDKKNWLQHGNQAFNKDFEDRWNSGKWNGYSYYRTPTLSYRYVQQMANALASQHKITVKVGNDWVCDLKTKTLTYNPASLVYSSKSELLATLLHEIGKLRYSKSMDDLKYNRQGKPLSTYLNRYGKFAYNAMTPFEELRIDTKMLGEYGSAGEIYESQEPSLQVVYNNYKKLSENVKAFVVSQARSVFDGMLRKITGNVFDNQQFEEMIRAKMYMQAGVDEQEALTKAITEVGRAGYQTSAGTRGKIMAAFGVPTVEEAKKEFAKMEQSIFEKDTLYDYIASVYSEAYLLKKDADFSPGMVERLRKTTPSFKPIVKHTDAVEVVGEMDANVYPVIEDLLDDAKDCFDELEKFGKQFKEEVNHELQRALDGLQEKSGGGVDEQGKNQVRMSKSSGQTNKTTVPEWFSGDYRVLKDSVRGEITRLTRMLTFLKRTEQVIKWTDNQRRGRLNMKKLYRAKIGNRRVFKSRIENTDTVRSFAFSILLDVSGSMQGARIANTTRGLIILAEVFKDMGIPFEIITFSDGAKTIKAFSGTLDKAVEKSIGGLPKCDGGGTNLNRGIEKMKLKEQPERNKVCIVLTDGGVGSPDEYNRQYFNPMLQKDHIKSLAFGLEISQREIERLCNGTGKAIENAAEVPVIFADLLKSLIIKK